jgi:serine/threonine protein phosphatase PrpC
MKYNYRSLTNVGKVRKANEDSCGEFKTPHGTLLIVCDGMGGHVGGAVASSTAVEKVYEYINNRDSSLGYQTLLNQAIIFANEQVFGLSTVKPELKGMGTTCVVVLISDSGLVYYAHVGDSRLYLLRDKGIKRVTTDHSLVQLLHDQGQITEDEMETHPNKNQILKAIGTDFDLRPEVCKEPMQMFENDILLICSDGLCGMVHDRDIARITYANISNLENATQLLIDEANNNGGKDNITATLVSFGQPQDQKVLMTAAPIQNTESPKNNKKWLLYGGMAVLLLALVGFLVWGRAGKTELSYCECYKNLSDRIKGEKSDSLKILTYEKDSEECNKKKKESCKEQTELEKTIVATKKREFYRLENYVESMVPILKERRKKMLDVLIRENIFDGLNVEELELYFSDATQRSTLYKSLYTRGLYTKSKEEFDDQYFCDIIFFKKHGIVGKSKREDPKKSPEEPKKSETITVVPSSMSITQSTGHCIKEISHRIERFETISSITEKYKNECLNLKIDDLITANKSSYDIKVGDKITFTCKCKE